MLASESRRTLIGDWNPPEKTKGVNESTDVMPVEEEKVVKTYYNSSYSTDGCGITFQRCNESGTGRRVFRKRIGGV